MAASWLLLATATLLHFTLQTCNSFGPMQKPPTSITLYGRDPNIRELFVSNFTATVCRSNRAWAVQFYSSTCGGCQKFRPTWLALAEDIHKWRRMVKLAAAPCSHPDNTVLCRNHNIGAYPTIKYFPPSSATDFTGLIYECPKTVTGLRMCMIDFLEGVVHTPIWWPRLSPFRAMRDLHRYLSDNGYNNRTVLILFEELASTIVHRNYIAREVILDMTEHQRLFVARMLRQQGVNLGVTSYPSLYQLNQDHSLTLLAESLDRRGFVEVIESEVLGIHKSPDDVTTQASSNALPAHVEPVIPDGVHEQDLESSLYYTFWYEVAMKQTITGPALETLKSYINLLAELLPVSGHVRQWLNTVRAWLVRQTEVPGGEWTRALDNLQTHTAYIPERVIWVGCRGSEPRYRGYSCSLWLTFHTLVAAAHNASQFDEAYSAKDVLITIREFVRHFFTCRECRDHFLETSANLKNEVSDNDAAVLWLWDTHNDVNRRIHGDLTEDPYSPKMQFPVYQQCEECHVTQPSTMFMTPSWHASRVLEYLLDFYGGDQVIRDSAEYTFYTGRSYYLTESASPCLASSPLFMLAAVLTGLLS